MHIPRGNPSILPSGQHLSNLLLYVRNYYNDMYLRQHFGPETMTSQLIISPCPGLNKPTSRFKLHCPIVQCYTFENPVTPTYDCNYGQTVTNKYQNLCCHKKIPDPFLKKILLRFKLGHVNSLNIITNNIKRIQNKRKRLPIIEYLNIKQARIVLFSF